MKTPAAQINETNRAVSRAILVRPRLTDVHSKIQSFFIAAHKPVTVSPNTQPSSNQYPSAQLPMTNAQTWRK